MSVLDFSDPLVLTKRWIKIGAAWNDGHIEETAADGPIALIPFHGCAIIVAPGITCVVE